MYIRKGDKFICTEDVNNIFGLPLFKKDEIYEVIMIDYEKVKTFITLNHILYGNEHMEYELDWILTKFKKL